MLKKGTKYIPSCIPEKESNNINKIIENKLRKFTEGKVDPNSDYYDDTYRIQKLNCSSNRKAFIVKYMFTYEENVKADDVYQVAMEEDNWSADSVEQAILYTYKNFGKSYSFRKKYGDKKNLKFLGIYDVYVKLHYSYIFDCYSNNYSTWNTEFSNYCNSENNSKEK